MSSSSGFRPAVGAALLALMLAISGCGGEQQATPPESPSPVSTTPAPSDAFVLSDAGGEDYQGRPALRLRFSQPLVAEQAFDELLLVRDDKGADVSGSWVLDDEDARVLRFRMCRATRPTT